MVRKLIALACALTVVAGIATILHWRREHRGRVHHGIATGNEAKDSRSTDPGVHRAGPAELAVRNRVALAESQKLIAAKSARRPDAISVAATSWVPLGPTNAFNEFNSLDIPGVDSGRPNSIVVDPRDGNVVYNAVSGGGLWKTYNFLAATGPTWSPLSDNLPNLAIGAMALDPAAPDTLYVGNGDFVDASGDTVMKSTDGGSTWVSTATLLGALSTRSIAVFGNTVIVGTDVGMFRSNDAGATFALIDLPNPGGRMLVESIWSVIYLGGNSWAASGVQACDEMSGPPPLSGGADPGAACSAGNNALIWTSPDGVNWNLATLPSATGTGRVTIAAGTATVTSKTVVYAYVGAVDNGSTLGFWRSNDGGATWVDATGTLANPSLPFDPKDPTSADCGDLNIGHDQTWYNQAMVVDPTNPDHVLIGGNLCGARTLNGTAPSPKWELVSSWLPNPMTGATANGLLPYVHADWHTATSVTINGALRTFAGTDGGVFSSTNVFDPATTAESVVWTNHNASLVTHLVYSIGSGDPTTGNPFVLISGLQDNGTRYRVDPMNPSVFNQPIGGDGIGATVHVATSGTTYWASAEFSHDYCQPSATVDCSMGENWNSSDPTLDPDLKDGDDDDDVKAHGRNDDDADGDREAAREIARTHAKQRAAGDDDEPFNIHYANVETDTTGQSVLTHSDGQIFVSSTQGDGTLGWTAISQDLTAANQGFSNVTASRTTPNLYGAAGSVSIAPFFYTTMGNTPSTWIAAAPVTPTGTADRLTGPASMDFPPVLPAGTTPGQVFIGSFTNTLNDAARTPPPDDKGRLYRTTDFGQTWTSIVGADPAHRLPNVPVYVAKYDPVTPTTIYAATDIGVYVTTDDAATWNRMGDGLPMISTRDLYVAKNQDFIRVATYGRGMWEIYPSAAANQGEPGNGDYDRNLAIDWVDVGAMASRLGDTPATTAPPLYTWILDLTSATGTAAPLQLIDDADLTALLVNFGGHP